ncbi:hypothetical protein [[Flexibacter] sp. ATCC 35103]|uniref:hypothetical protein n=1 Tax=[Flexibacter] sp. ATCC 35103 TaxID=1937528 RepID=UPI0009D2DFE8|nr:hypothetical protein [[Flexibacter] sp. ATCC 35103]OMQ09100.1 hypothetical protein BXU01_19330 [[Flexibacter] sp. ATCC 35103]
MSQDISLIIFAENDFEIAAEMPHFINSGVLYIPVPIFEGFEYGELITDVLNKNDSNMLNYKNDYHFIELANEIGAKNYIALHFSEYGSMTINHYEFAVLENVFIKDSIWSTGGLITSENIDSFEENYENNKGEILLNIKVDHNFIEHLKNYGSCKSVYEKWGNKVNFQEVQNYYIQKQLAERTDINFDERGYKTFTADLFTDASENIATNSNKEQMDKFKTLWKIIKYKFKI